MQSYSRSHPPTSSHPNSWTETDTKYTTCCFHDNIVYTYLPGPWPGSKHLVHEGTFVCQSVLICSAIGDKKKTHTYKLITTVGS